MVIRDPVCLSVIEPSQVGEARRLAAGLSEALGFDEISRSDIAIVVTEIATNLVHHAKGGEILLRSLPVSNCCGLQVLGLDRGPGIGNLANALRDGFTTRATAGTGMGAIRRLSAEFDLHSSLNQGTALLAQFYLGDVPSVLPANTAGWVCLPIRGESACGDACEIIHLDGGRSMIMIADGLGHGVQAAGASRKAVQLFVENATMDGPRLMEVLHAGLRSTRGAAVSIADIRRGQHEIRFTGVGNVAGRLISPKGQRGMVTQNGTVGAEARRIQEYVYPWLENSLLIMHSDGLSSQWKLDDYKGLENRHASLIAGVLYRDFRRDRDDVSVLAFSERVSP